MSPKNLLCLVGAVAAALAMPRAALSCPFCNAVTRTLSEEIKDSSVAVLARLIERPKTPEAQGSDAKPRTTDEVVLAKFEIEKVLKGPQALAEQPKFDVLYFGQQPIGSKFLVLGVDMKDASTKAKSAPKFSWAAPIALTGRGIEYITALPGLAESGPERLAFFQEYLEDAESMLATDAYDEFARAPYAEVKQLGPKMHRDRLLAWIKNPDVSPSRRRLYLTMLGVCGQDDDLPILEAMLRSPDRQVRVALDAIIACYVILKGPDGLPLVEELFLKDEKAEYIDTYSAITALRFLGQESTAVPKARLMEALRHILDRPKLADLVIPDLARWQDWSVVEKLVQLFKDADEQSSWVRVPVVNYLRACPKPEAKEYLAELAKIDPESVKRANSFFPPAGAKPPAPAEPAGGLKTAAPKSSGAKSAGSKTSGAKSGKPAGDGEKPSSSKPSSNKPSSNKTSAIGPTPGQPGATAVDGSEAGQVAAVTRGAEPRSQGAGAVDARRPTPAPTAKEVSTFTVVSTALAATAIVFLILLVILRGSFEFRKLS